MTPIQRTLGVAAAVAILFCCITSPSRERTTAQSPDFAASSYESSQSSPAMDDVLYERVAAVESTTGELDDRVAVLEREHATLAANCKQLAANSPSPKSVAKPKAVTKAFTPVVVQSTPPVVVRTPQTTFSQVFSPPPTPQPVYVTPTFSPVWSTPQPVTPAVRTMQLQSVTCRNGVCTATSRTAATQYRSTQTFAPRRRVFRR